MEDAQKVGGSGVTNDDIKPGGSYDTFSDKITRLVTVKNKNDPNAQGTVLRGKRYTYEELDKKEGLGVIAINDQNEKRIAEKDAEIMRIRALSRGWNGQGDNPEWTKFMESQDNPVLTRRELAHLKYEQTGNYQYESEARTPDATFVAQQRARQWSENNDVAVKKKQLEDVRSQEPQATSLDQYDNRPRGKRPEASARDRMLNTFGSR